MSDIQELYISIDQQEQDHGPGWIFYYQRVMTLLFAFTFLFTFIINMERSECFTNLLTDNIGYHFVLLLLFLLINGSFVCCIYERQRSYLASVLLTASVCLIWISLAAFRNENCIVYWILYLSGNLLMPIIFLASILYHQ